MSSISAREALRYAFHTEYQKLYIILFIGLSIQGISSIGFGLAFSFWYSFTFWLWLLFGLLMWLIGVLIVATTIVSIAYRFRRTAG